MPDKPTYVIHDEDADTYTMKTTTYRTYVWAGVLAGVAIGMVLGIAMGVLLGRAL